MARHSGTFLGYRDEHGNEVHCSRDVCSEDPACRRGCAHPVSKPVVEGYGFDMALHLIKRGKRMRRPSWNENRFIRLRRAEREQDAPRYRAAVVSYIELCDTRGASSPWTPTRCDLLEEDWYQW